MTELEAFLNSRAVWIDYKNHRGEQAVRRIVPIRLFWGSTPWHPDAQWFLEATDLAKEERRTFAMADLRWVGTERGA